MKFSDFNIKPTSRGFEGEKIKMSKILDREIIVHAFRIENSKVKEFKEKGNGMCLHLQIEHNGERRIVFTSSTGLIDTIGQVPESGFPFTTTIIRENDRFKFS